MYIFCKIHTSNYNDNKGCHLWLDTEDENYLRHQSENDCLPAKSHPKYRKVIRLRPQNKTQKRR